MLATLRERLVPPLNRDGRLVIAASAVRALDYGFLSIFLGVYLSLLDFSALQAGLVFGSIMAGGALSNVVCTWRGDAIGRRRMLVTMSGLMVLGGPVRDSVLLNTHPRYEGVEERPTRVAEVLTRSGA